MAIQLDLTRPGTSASGTSPVVEIADHSVRLARIAQDLLDIARKSDDPRLLEALSGPIEKVMETSRALSSSVLRQAAKGQ